VEARKTMRAFWREEKMLYGSSGRRVLSGCAGRLAEDMSYSDEIIGVVGEAVGSSVVTTVSGCGNYILLRAEFLLYTAKWSSAGCTVVDRWIRS
jgi:hypothetical protein